MTRSVVRAVPTVGVASSNVTRVLTLRTNAALDVQVSRSVLHFPGTIVRQRLTVERQDCNKIM